MVSIVMFVMTSQWLEKMVCQERQCMSGIRVHVNFVTTTHTSLWVQHFLVDFLSQWLRKQLLNCLFPATDETMWGSSQWFWWNMGSPATSSHSVMHALISHARMWLSLVHAREAQTADMPSLIFTHPWTCEHCWFCHSARIVASHLVKCAAACPIRSSVEMMNGLKHLLCFKCGFRHCKFLGFSWETSAFMGSQLWHVSPHVSVTPTSAVQWVASLQEPRVNTSPLMFSFPMISSFQQHLDCHWQDCWLRVWHALQMVSVLSDLS